MRFETAILRTVGTALRRPTAVLSEADETKGGDNVFPMLARDLQDAPERSLRASSFMVTS